MKGFLIVVAMVLCPVPAAWAWGQEGHSIVAEIAQRRLAAEAPQTMVKIQNILGPGVSLASLASWADAYRDEDPGSENWHFVDIPIAEDSFDRDRQCARKPTGDCIVAELERLRNDIRCKQGAEQQNALKFAIHLAGDIHQPLHTVGDDRGGNTIDVTAFMHGDRCKENCRMSPLSTNLHAAWDVTLIEMTRWDWGSYVTRLEQGWLAGVEAQTPGLDSVNFVRWANETHAVAQQVWRLTPASNILDQRYYDQVLPILDRQLGLAGLRLTRLLQEAFASEQCPVP